MEAALASALVSGGGMTAGAAAVKAGAIMSTMGTVATVAGTGMSLLGGVQSARMQQAAYNQQAMGTMIERQGLEQQAAVEKLKAQEESNIRRERLLNALAAQNVKSGAGGVKGGTTEQMRLQSISEYDKEQQGADLMADYAQTGLANRGTAMEAKAAGQRASGKQAKYGALTSTGLSLLRIG